MSTTTDTTAATTNSGAGRDGGSGDQQQGLSGVRQSAADAYESARDRTSAAYSAARERAGSAYETARRRTGEGIDANPMAAVAGGLALGALLGALLPRTRQEEEVLGPVGRRINRTARDAAKAAKDAGRQQLDEIGLSRDGARRKLEDAADKAAGIVRTSAGAAAERVRGQSGQ